MSLESVWALALFTLAAGICVTVWAWSRAAKRRSPQASIDPVESDAGPLLHPVPGHQAEAQAAPVMPSRPVVLRTGLRWKLWLRYASGSAVTERTVTVLDVLGAGPGAPVSHIRARCHETNAIRTFLHARVQAAADGETGEVIDDLNALLLSKGHPPADVATTLAKAPSRPRKPKAAPDAGEPKRRGRPTKVKPDAEPRVE